MPAEAAPVRRIPSYEWVGRRWFEMRIGYGTYLAFTFGFANFILILHGLTDLFKDYPLHWFAVALVLLIVPVAILIGHRHNRTQQKTETRTLTHLNPYVDKILPNSKEELHAHYVLLIVEWMIHTSTDDSLKSDLKALRTAYVRYIAGEDASVALHEEEKKGG